MSQLFSPYLSAINKISWQNIEDFSFPSHFVKQWLLEPGSLTKRLQSDCEQFSVELLCNQWRESTELNGEEQSLLYFPGQYLLREVLLHGDETPWVIGHSLIPQITALDQQGRLANLGTTPLGESVFQSQTVERDHLQVAIVEIEQVNLYARRSRLWMNHNPMLVTELFLPLAPIYRQESL